MLRLSQKLKFINKNSIEFGKRIISTHKSLKNQTSTSSITDAPEQDEQVAGKVSKKLQARPPLAKNFFVGSVDRELLAFPEVINREEMANLNNELLPLKNYFADEFDYQTTAKTFALPKDLAEHLKQLGLYGLNVPGDFDGKGWGYSASLIASEPESEATEVALGLLGHRVIVDVIQEQGTDEQKHRFLTKLGNGSFVASEAIFEQNAAEDDMFSTRAQYESDSHTWVLNGTKSFVVAPPKTPSDSQLFLVVAQTQKANIQNEAGQATTIFLVDANTAGVNLGERHQTIGCRSTVIQEVQFNNARVSDTNVLGHADRGNVVAEALLKSMRLRSSLIACGLAKNILKTISKESINKRICNVPMKDLETVKTHLAKSCMSIYSMESMIYLTAGLLDEFESPDVSLEAAMTKYFSVKELFNIAMRPLDLIGSKSLLSGELCENYFRNASQLYTHGESIDNLSLSIALVGLQHAGSLMGGDIRKQRNPLFNPGHIFSKFLDRSSIDEPKTNMDLKENLHPSLEPAALCLEHSVARLQMCVDLLLTRYGTEVVERHNEARRIADMSSTIYAVFASLARASRSYCIGLPLADHEMLSAMTISIDGHDRVKTLAQEIFHGQYVNNDNNLQRLSKQIVKSKGYFATHPLTYNF